jgi:hypothetical protein
LSRPLALHSTFPTERHTCPIHSLYTIFPTDSDVTAIDRPEPLTTDYFCPPRSTIHKLAKEDLPAQQNVDQHGKGAAYHKMSQHEFFKKLEIVIAGIRLQHGKGDNPEFYKKAQDNPQILQEDDLEFYKKV